MNSGPILIFGGNKTKRLEKIDQFISQKDKKLLTRQHPDFMRVWKEKTSIGIDQSKKIINYFGTKPFSSKVKCVVIEDAKYLTTQAQNALLKTLEEPPKFALILIETNNKKDLLETLISRCRLFEIAQSADKLEQSFDFYKIRNENFKTLTEVIEKISKEDKQDIVQILDNLTRDLRNELLQTNSTNTAFKIEKALEIKKDVQNTNVNVRLALEYLMAIIIT